MFAFRFKSIRTKLLVLVLSITVVLVGLSTLYQSATINSIQEQQLLQWSSDISERYAVEVRSELQQHLSLVHTLASSVVSISSWPDAAKESYLDSVCHGLAKSMGVTNAYVNFELGKYFAQNWKKAGLYPGTSWYDAGDGVIRKEVDEELNAYAIADTDDWYHLPQKLGHEVIIEPYYWTYKGGNSSEPMFITSICVPIYINSQFVGIAGIDLSLASMQKLVKDFHPVPESYAILVSNTGKRAAHPKKELLTKQVGDDMLDSGKALLAAIHDGKPFSVEKIAKGSGKLSLLRYSPVNIGNTASPWSLAVVLPLDNLRAPMVALRWKMAIISLILLLILAMAVFVAVDRVAFGSDGAVKLVGRGGKQVHAFFHQRVRHFVERNSGGLEVGHHALGACQIQLDRVRLRLAVVAERSDGRRRNGVDRVVADQRVEIERVGIGFVLCAGGGPQETLRARAALGQRFPARAGEQPLIIAIGELGVGDGHLAEQTFQPRLFGARRGL